MGLSGQFEFPENTTLVSAVYCLYSPVKFSKSIKLEIQHCAKAATFSTLRFVVAKCSQEKLPYKFKPLNRGVFSPNNSYGNIECSHFSIFGITQDGDGEVYYFAKLYYLGMQMNRPQLNWAVHFVISKDVEIYHTVSAISMEAVYYILLLLHFPTCTGYQERICKKRCFGGPSTGN